MAHRVLAIIGRRLFACLTVLSLLLCLATLALWVRSYWRHDSLYHCSSDAPDIDIFGLWSNFGELSLFTSRYPRDLEPGWHFHAQPSFADETISNFAKNFPQARSAHFLGFGFGHIPPPYDFDRYTAPHWFVALLFAALPAARLRSILRTLRTRHRRRAGLCLNCGYDLRATPPDGLCPECGESRSHSAGWE